MAESKNKKMQDAQIDFENEMIDIEQANKEIKNTYKANQKASLSNVRKRRIIIGAVFTVLAFVGVLSIFTGVVKIGTGLFDNSEEKQKYNNLLNTLVMYDPLPFESPEQADQNVLLASCLWSAISNEDMTQYETDEYEQTLLPAAVLDKYYSKLFGTQTKLTHGTFTDQDVEFVFNEDKQAYVIVPTSFPVGYSRQVAKIKKSFGEKTITVGYLSPQTSWADTGERTIAKYVDYIFEKQDGEYYLVAVRESNTKVEVAASSSTN